jgi:hypothetical protein
VPSVRDEKHSRWSLQPGERGFTMFNERAFLSKIESANVEDFAQILSRPTSDEETVLRVMLGDDRYERMHAMALRRNLTRSAVFQEGDKARGNVIVLHGIMGSELSTVDRSGNLEPIWFNVIAGLEGRLTRLGLGPDGRTEQNCDYDVRATGILKRYYGELLLSLSGTWNVRAFWYDWRKDLDLAAASLRASIESWFGTETPVHLVAHSMGGLVARSFIKRYPERWATMWDQKENGFRGGRLVMLGTPNCGSFDIVQVIAGIEPLVRKLSVLCFLHKAELLQALNSFVGSYQMLPSSLKTSEHPEIDELYKADNYKEHAVLQSRLDNARHHHEIIADVVDRSRMVYIAGYNQPTVCGIRDTRKFDSADSYEITLNGDGRVPHDLGLLKDIPTFYVEEVHGNLPANRAVLQAVDELLRTGTTTLLPQQLPATRGVPASEEDLRKRKEDKTRADELEIQRLRDHFASRASSGSQEYSSEERRIEELISRGMLGGYADDGNREAAGGAQMTIPSISIILWSGGIETDFSSPDGDIPAVDAISVGHYVGVRPQDAELAVDRAISTNLSKELSSPDSLMLTQFTDRGVLRGDLGQPFFLPDPRNAERVITIAGMGMPTRFGPPELTVLAREICWSLGRIGKKHLATVLIGSGNGNIPVPDAISAWLRGVSNALASALDDDHSLKAITICEKSASRFRDIESALTLEKRRMFASKRLNINLSFSKPVEIPPAALPVTTIADAKDKEAIPTRISIEVDGTVDPLGLQNYRFGALTATAAIPERLVSVQGTIVSDLNDALAAAGDTATQYRLGLSLQQFLLPSDLRDHLRGNAPVVMLLDRTTARIHWEMLAEPGSGSFDQRSIMDGKDIADVESYFFAIGRGFTRQLRTSFAAAPDPPAPPQRVLRVLVIADPAEDAHLANAEEEGAVVADLFESFNSVYGARTTSRVEVTRMFGPRKATLVNVLGELMVRSYDILHFAGHCVYNRNDPPNSGWIFSVSGNKRLTARELVRLDRIPKFVFSNACESGVTPDRPERRSPELIPSFAESFFGRGISNFVCTAWPVNDAAAREFAVRVYSGMLGLKQSNDRFVEISDRSRFEPMHVAMREARALLASQRDYGIKTWGAYQHYGNPFFRLFQAGSVSETEL